VFKWYQVSIVLGIIFEDNNVWVTFIFISVDIICGCIVTFIIQSCLKGLKEVAYSRTKGSRRDLWCYLKLIVFKRFYVILVVYLVLIRVLHFVLTRITKYSFKWVVSLTHEIITIIFYIVMFYMFI